MTRRGVVFLLLGAAGVVALYGFRLNEVPAYLGLDEFHFAVHGHSLATTGRDLNGSRLPLFISLEDPLGDRPVLPWGTTWYHPFGFYLIAAALTVIPLSEAAVRFPIVLIGALNVLLMYAAAYAWLRDRRIAAGAAALLALTPAHFILSRLALDYLLPVPFILAWLTAFGHFMRAPSRRLAVTMGLMLGAGCYSYVTSWLMMPLYLALTLHAIVRVQRQPSLVPALIAGFAVPLLALGPWVAFHPDMPGNILAQYQAGETRPSAVTAILRGEATGAAREAIAAYWSYFNPSFLFVNGGSSRMVSTGLIGVWPLSVAVLIGIALVRMSRRPFGMFGAVLVIGVLTAPIPAALKGEPFAIQRASALLPFVVLLAAAGLTVFEDVRAVMLKTIASVAILATVVQFTGFLRDYFGDYRIRSAQVIDGTAFRETARRLLDLGDRDNPPVIALTAPLSDVSAKWRFYATAAGRAAWLERTRYFGGSVNDLRDLPAGSLAVVESVGIDNSALAGWRIVEAPQSVTGERPLTILRRQ